MRGRSEAAEGGRYSRYPRPFNAALVRVGARVKPDLRDQVRKFSSGMTLAAGGVLKTPAKWGSGCV